MKVCTLASGSSGNSLFIQTNSSKILIDAGISLRQIKAKLNRLDVELSDLDAVIISHEHLDHAMSIPKIENPTYVASATIPLWKDKVKNLHEFSTGTSFSIKDVVITTFSVPHDALDPVGFTVETDHRKLGIVTDIGMATSLVRERLKGSNILIIEFNHDEDIIRESNYPWEIKQRIMGRLGHLSNAQGANLFSSLLHNELSYLLLAHLSETNNRNDVALRTASSVIEKSGADHISISIAPRKALGEVLIV
jgi:phosphoribosyl 1,2-cyclic phosphodiesterase